QKLSQVRVVGFTCAACVFPCLDKLKFQILLLDECSQMTEPASLLPMARFECQKLVLVGDPKVSGLNNLFYGDHKGRHPSLYPTFPLKVLPGASFLFDSPFNHLQDKITMP
ncbi:unnamed protein product, partial [Porites evermanni]